MARGLRGGGAAHGSLLVAVVVAGSSCGDTAGPAEPDLGSWVSVVTGKAHACALNGDGSSWCWGDNTWGQFGDATNTSSPVPVIAAGDRRFESIAAAGDHTCGLTTSGELLCWGRNDVGELGIGTPFASPVPQTVSGGPFERVHSGFYFSCGTDARGSLSCWGGSRWTGSLPVTPSADCPGYYAAFQWPCARAPVPFDQALPLDQLDLGLFFGCGITSNGSAVCWGMNDHGQLASTAARECQSAGAVQACDPTPMPIDAPVALRSVSTGDVHACGLDAGGRAYCWGATRFGSGELGTGEPGGATAPTAVQTSERFQRIRAAKGNLLGSHTCAVNGQGAAWCWGYGEDGALGAPSTGTCPRGTDSVGCSLLPEPVQGGLAFEDLSLGRSFTCGLVEGGDSVYCWGRNEAGQLGDGTTSGGWQPRAVALPEG